ncbi:MAG: hypothetical protein R3C10_26970 [Pirellulales bacterium]
MSIDWSRFKSIVQEHDEFLLTSHIRPDCDALGSELGMAGVLTALGSAYASSTPTPRRRTSPSSIPTVDSNCSVVTSRSKNSSTRR